MDLVWKGLLKVFESSVSSLVIARCYKCFHRFIIISLMSARTWRKEQGESSSRFVLSSATCLFIYLCLTDVLNVPHVRKIDQQIQDD